MGQSPFSFWRSKTKTRSSREPETDRETKKPGGAATGNSYRCQSNPSLLPTLFGSRRSGAPPLQLQQSSSPPCRRCRASPFDWIAMIQQLPAQTISRTPLLVADDHAHPLFNCSSPAAPAQTISLPPLDLITVIQHPPLQTISRTPPLIARVQLPVQTIWRTPFLIGEWQQLQQSSSPPRRRYRYHPWI